MSIASCDNCGDYIAKGHASGWRGAILCSTCREAADDFLFEAIKATEKAHYMSQQTDNAYANSGRWHMRMERLRDLRQARIDLEKGST